MEMQRPLRVRKYLLLLAIRDLEIIITANTIASVTSVSGTLMANMLISTETIVMALLILFFCYFYAQIQFNPEEVARNIQQYGGFIQGIRPGKPTYEYLKKVSRRITLFGAIYLAFIALIPGILFSVLGGATLVNAMTATGMLIVVSVGLEFDKQLQSLMMMKQYKGFLK